MRQFLIPVATVCLAARALSPVCQAAPVDSNRARPSPIAAPAQPTLVTLPSGTELRVRLNQSIGTKRNRSGDRFEAILDSPITAGGSTIPIPRGTVVHGVIQDAEPSGRLKGRATVVLTLDSIDLNGRQVHIETASVTRTSDKHRKRSLWIGGGAGTGALIGGLAAGPVGAVIGAGAGATAGLTTTAVRGKKQLRLPAESVITFRLREPAAIHV